MPPLSDGLAVLSQLFDDADLRGEGLSLTVRQVKMVATAMRWASHEVANMRDRLRALEIEVAALEAVGRELELPLGDTPTARERAKQALLDAMAVGKVVMIDQLRRPAFCDGGAHVPA